MPTTKRFVALLEKGEEKADIAYVSIPYDVGKTYGSKGMIKVKAKFDGHPYRGILSNMGTGCHIIIVLKEIRKAIGKQVGDKVTVEITLDTEERIVNIPDDLADALLSSKKASAFFETLSYTNRKEYTNWITSAKRTETRIRRVTETIQKLLNGLKNPSQKISG